MIKHIEDEKVDFLWAVLYANYPAYVGNREIYHYTSPIGFQGIIENKSLWFTRSDCLNDYSEGLYIEQVYKNSIVGLRSSNDINDDFFELIKDIRPKNTQLIGRTTTQEEKERFEGLQKSDKEQSCFPVPEKCFSLRECDTYICCFSKSQDSLPMWNYYSKSGRYEGYNIGFHCGTGWGFCSDTEVFHVVYSESDQTRLIQAMVKRAYKFWQSGGDCQEAKSTITECLSNWQFMFKHPSFQHEEEVRAIYYRPIDDNELDKLPSVHFRTSNGMIIPYIELEFGIDDPNNECVFSVTVAPLIKDKIATETTKQFLVSQGFPYQIVDNSKIPIRF